MPATYTITRADDIGVSYLSLVIDGHTVTTMWIRDDMNLDVQCDTMVADTLWMHCAATVDTDSLLESIRTDLSVARNAAGVTNPA